MHSRCGVCHGGGENHCPDNKLSVSKLHLFIFLRACLFSFLKFIGRVVRCRSNARCTHSKGKCMSFPPAVKEDALVASGRHCCLCHRFCGTKIEVHHIRLESEGGDNALENAISLCFDCHADMTSYDAKHPKGTKYTETELKRHRDNWYKKVAGVEGLLRPEEAATTDKKNYEHFLSLLPWNGSIHFIRHSNFAGFSFDLDQLNDLHKFHYECESPSFEFIDSDLEGLRASLNSCVSEFLRLIAIETFPTHTVAGWNSVPEEWQDEQPERFERVVKDIHAAATNVCEAYDDLVRLATRKLGIVPET